MKLSDDHKVQIFCTALNATLLKETTYKPDTSRVIKDPVEVASLLALQAIGRLQSKDWSSK